MIWKILFGLAVLFFIVFIWALCKIGKLVEIDEERFADDLINGGIGNEHR